MCSALFFKFRGDVRQQVADMQVLRADLFAFAAADAVGGPKELYKWIRYKY